MAYITIPLEEAIHVFQASVQLPGIIRRIEATAQGPRVVVRLNPIMPEFGILIRFIRFENSVAQFILDGLPSFINLGTLVQLPPGIESAGDRLNIRPATLLQQIGLKGLAVKSMAWQNGAYQIETSAIK